MESFRKSFFEWKKEWKWQLSVKSMQLSFRNPKSMTKMPQTETLNRSKKSEIYKIEIFTLSLLSHQLVSFILITLINFEAIIDVLAPGRLVLDTTKSRKHDNLDSDDNIFVLFRFYGKRRGCEYSCHRYQYHFVDFVVLSIVTQNLGVSTRKCVLGCE